MEYRDLLELAPALEAYGASVPPEIEGHFTLKTYPAHAVIHMKDSQLVRIGILLSGQFRVINEFENGNIFMIELNEPISFVGEVTLLAEAQTTSVTIETVTPCQIAFLPVEDFDLWLRRDIHFLRRVSTHVAQKLYCSSYNRGERLYYSSTYLVLKYLIGCVDPGGFGPGGVRVLPHTRSRMAEEVGMTLKTLNRTVNTLRGDGAVSLSRGKVMFTWAQYEAGKKQLAHYLRQSKNGVRGK